MNEKTKKEIEELIGKSFRNDSDKEFIVLEYLGYCEKKHCFLIEFLETGNQKKVTKFDIKTKKIKDIWYDVNGKIVASKDFVQEVEKLGINYFTVTTNLFRNGLYKNETVEIKKAVGVKLK